MIIKTEELERNDIPSETNSWVEIETFIQSFDYHDEHPFQAIVQGIDKVGEKKDRLNHIINLRSALVWELNHLENKEPSKQKCLIIQRVLKEIKDELG